MIRSLRSHLEELEKEVEMPPRSQAKDSSLTSGDSQPPQHLQEPLEPTRVADHGSDGSPAEDFSAFQSSDLVLDEAGADSGCIEPCGFEQLMPPIDLRAEVRVTSTSLSKYVKSPRTGTATTINNTGCKCDRALEAMRCRLPLRRHADNLVTIYFSRHQRMIPVLHEPTFMKQYHALWESTHTSSHGNTQGLSSCLGLCKQKSKGTLFPATLNAVFSLAALFASRSSEDNAEQAREFFRLAESIDIFEALDEEVGIELVQLVLLMGCYLQSTERFSKCWNVGGLAIRMAQNMGLHFSISEARKRGLLSSSSTQLDCEMRARVWYGCVILET